MVVGGCRWFQVILGHSMFQYLRNQNCNSEFFSVEGFLPASELPGISSSVSKRGPYKAFAIFSLPDRKGTLLNDTLVENFSVETVTSLRFGPCDLVFVPLAPAFTVWRPFWNKVYMSF